MSWFDRNWPWLALGIVVGGAALVAAKESVASPTPPTPPNPTPTPQPSTVLVTLTDGVMPPVTVTDGLNIQLANGGSITGLTATSGYLLGDNTPGPEAKAVGTPPNSGTAGSNTIYLGWSIPAAGKGTSGTITVVWFDSSSVAHQSQIPVTLV